MVMVTSLTVGKARARARRARMTARDVTIRRAKPRGWAPYEVVGPAGYEPAADVVAVSERGLAFVALLPPLAQATL